MKQMRMTIAVLGVLTALSLGYAEKHAILIQVVKYRDPKIPSYTGGADSESLDAVTMKRALERHQFRSFTQLSDSQATREAILQAMEDVRRETKPGDVVVFYFSGHGAASQEGVSIAPYDAVAQNPSNDITAKDLADWVRQLPTDHVVIFLDCCFYYLPRPNSRRPPIVRPKVIPERAVQGASDWGELGRLDKGVIITATESGKEAFQYYTGTLHPQTRRPQWLGFFTSALSTELEQAAQQGRQLTYDELSLRVARSMADMIANAGYTFIQKSQILGAVSLRSSPVFGSDGNSVAPSPTPPTTSSTVKPVKVYLDPNIPESLREQVMQSLKTFVGSKDVPIEVIESRIDAIYVVERHQNQIVLRDLHGLLDSVLMTLGTENADPTKDDAISASEKLSELAVNHATLRLLLSHYVEHFASRDKRLQIKIDKDAYQIGEKLWVEIVPPRCGYLILVSRTADGELSLLFPYEGDKNLMLSSGSSYKFPMQKDLDYIVKGPAGKDFICAILVDSEADQQAILRALPKKPAERATTHIKGLEPVFDLEGILQRLIREGKCEIGYIEFAVTDRR